MNVNNQSLSNIPIDMVSIKSFLRNLYRQRSHTLINLTGFSLSMAVVFVLAAFLLSEFSINRHYPNADHTYLLVREDRSASLPEGLLTRLRHDIPGIVNATMWNAADRTFTDQAIEGRALMVDDAFFSIFSVRPVTGDSIIDLKRHVYITPVFSDKVSSASDTLLPLSVENYTMGGLIPESGLHSGFQYDMLVNRDAKWSSSQYCDQNGCEYIYACAVLLDEKANVDTVEARINRYMPSYSMVGKHSVTLEPFKSVYFQSDITNDFMSHANSTLIGLLVIITLATLLLAILNYISLTTAINATRLTEMSIRKALGADNRVLFKQLLTETYLMCVLSVMLAFLASLAIKSLFESILGKGIALSALYDDPISIGLFGVFILVLGFIAGAIPASVAVRNMAKSQTGTTGRRKGIGRTIINIVQFSVSIVLIIGLLTINKQVNYVKHKDLGFCADQLVRVDLYLWNSKAKALKETLLTNPSILAASLSMGGPGHIMASGGAKNDSVNIDYYGYIFADKDFLTTFDIPLLKGVDLTENDESSVLINETFYEILGGGELESLKFGQEVFKGVTGDFHCSDLHQSIFPLFIKRLPESAYPSIINLKCKTTDLSKTMTFIEQTVMTFQPGTPFKYQFYDDWFDSMYKQEENQASAVRLFALLAILISCLGLYGLAEFNIRRRTKEIGVRRVNGATIADILFLLNKDFVKPVLVAIVIASPIGYVIMRAWLANFAYRTTLDWWIFCLAGLFTVGIALLSVSLQSWKASSRNPVDSMRYE